MNEKKKSIRLFNKFLFIGFLMFNLALAMVSGADVPDKSEIPTVGGSTDTWGDENNRLWNDTIDFLNVSLTRDGKLKTGLNATFYDLNVTNNLIVIGNIFGEIPDSFKLLNYSTEYSASGFKLLNYSTEYANSGFKIGNFTTLYGVEYGLTGWKIGNYSLEYAATGFNNLNFTTRLNVENASLWNRSGTNTFLRFIGDNVGIGTTTPLEALHIIGNINVTNNLILGDGV